MNYPWIRILKVKFSNDAGSSITIGGKGSEHLTISVICNKFLSTVKDDATIRIKNLSYTEILKLITGKYYNVEITCGYENRGSFVVFSGGVLYMSNSLGDRKTNELIVLCASKLIAKFGQVRMSLTINSSINLYSAMSFICRHVGIKDAVVPRSLAKQVLTECKSFDNQTIQTTLDYFAEAYKDVIDGISADDSNGATATVIPTDIKQARTIIVDDNTIDISGGYPRMTNSGLNLTVIPTNLIRCGDILKVNNALINIPVTERSQIYNNTQLKLNSRGLYRVKQMEYDLTNRSQEFSLNLVCMLSPESIT